MTDFPFMKFYPGDWRSDPRLRICGLSARGLWIEMIGLMHEAEPYGHLLVSGLCPTDTQLAMLVGAPAEQIPELLGELESAGVFSRTRAGVIYSRRMARTAKKGAIARKNGLKGGNPTLSNKETNRTSDKGQVKGGDKTQRLEARDQTLSVPSEPRPKPPPAGPDFATFWEAWPNKNAKAKAIAPWRRLSAEDRVAAINAIPLWWHHWRARNPDASPILPASWLNGRRWEDQFTEAPKGKGSRWGNMGATPKGPIQ